MKTMKLKKTILAVILVVTANTGNAQWAVIDAANLVVNNSILGALSANLTRIDNSLKSLHHQTVSNMQVENALNAARDGRLEMARKAMEMVPSLDECAQLSQNVPNGTKSRTVSASMRGSGGGGSNGSVMRANGVTSTATAMAKVLETKVELETCNEEVKGAAGCKSNGSYAGGDMHPRGIKGNIKGVNQANENEPMYNNYTFDEKGWDVAKKYAADMAYYDKPKVVPEEQMKKNPAYAALYQSVQTKLNAAHNAIIDIARIRRASDPSVLNSFPGQVWNQIPNDKYQKITGLKQKSSTPSLFELVNYEVLNDYFGNEEVDLSSIEEVNKRLAISNFIAWQKYQQQENTNMLLAHILVQLTTPASKARVDAEHIKTANLK